MRDPASIYVAISFFLSISLSLIIGLTGGHESKLIALTPIAMLIPAAAVLILRVTMNERAQMDTSRFPISYLPLALLLMPTAMHAAMLPFTIHIIGGLP
jgi:hypothetical protein